jgi:alpha-L-rhamnosidase
MMNVSNQVFPNQLTCNYAVNPLGIDTRIPSLSWQLKGEGCGRRQSAFQILVASLRERLDRETGDVWDSDRMESDQSVHVPYAGPKLRSRRRYWWKVRVWDEQGRQGPWGEPAFWEMGLLEEKDWHAQWIASTNLKPLPDMTSPPAPYFRKTFILTKPIVSARAYICGLGYYELYLNGRKVGDNVLDPLYTKYDARSLYVTHDITNMVVGGKNAIGVVLGSGWYNHHTNFGDNSLNQHEWPWRHTPKVILQMHFEYKDGTQNVIISDASWKTRTGPIVFDGLRNGEFYDARLEMPGWCEANFDDSAWEMVFVTSAPGGALASETLPIKVMQTLRPVEVTEPKPGVFVVDMGQNMAGWVQLRVQGPPGIEVTLRYAENLGKDGDIDQGNINCFIKTGQTQTDKYTLKGGGEEVWEPRFTYHGFQYVQVTGFPGRLTVDNIQGKVVHSAFQSAGRFECSNDLLNRIQNITRWAYISNYIGTPTDCPHREKLPWTGDALIAAETGLFNYTSAPAYIKWMDDFSDVQRKSGQLPCVVPTGTWGYTWYNFTWDNRWCAGPAWDSAYTHIPWYLYLYCGDLAVLRRHFPGMKRYVDFLTSLAVDHILDFGLGDWCPPYGNPPDSKTPTALTSTGYYHANCRLLSRVAILLGRKADARKYQSLAKKIQKAFNKKFFNPATGEYTPGNQTAMGCALFQGLVDEKDRPKAEKALLDAIEKNKRFLDYGILGAKYVPNVLADAGRTDVAYAMATQTEYPSYGHWVERGATTLWERWNGDQSHNHIMFGDISAWLFKALAGINPDPDRPGFKNVVIRPRPVKGLDWVRAEHQGPYGTIRSAWENTNGIFKLTVSVPANTTAEIWMPVADAAKVRENGRPAQESEAVKFVRSEDGCSVFEAGSGEYSFEMFFHGENNSCN